MSYGYIGLNMYSLIVLFILIIVFFSKKRAKQIEDNTYSVLLIASIITLVIGLISGCVFFLKPNHYLLISNILSKIYLISMLCIFMIFIFYTLCISKFVTVNVNKSKKIFIIITLAISVIILLLSMNISDENGIMVVAGASGFFAYTIYGICYFLLTTIIIVSHEAFFRKKNIPIILFIVGGIFLFTFQMIFTNINYLNNPFIVIVVLVMYFTIENPDAKLVEYERTEAERAQAASLAKSEFLSSMSHELRTPLNAIVGLSEDIDSYNESVPKDVREDTKDIINASNTLLEIIGSILDISKIESGKLDIVESDYDPKEEFESLAKIMRTKFNEKNLEFNVSLAENIPEVLFGDRLRIKQIINNLLSNACKYTDSGRVDFKVEWLDASGSLRIIVKDTGTGVKKEDIDKLFNKYDRLGVEKTSSVQGTGLGLAITKTLIDLMGGTVDVESEVMVGTTFTVVIPQKYGSKEELERIRREAERKVEKVDYTGKRILVVDDNMLNIKVFKKAIKDFNFTIEECYNGEEAIGKIELNNNYDIVFMDIKMPVMSGEDAMAHLVNMENFIAPVVALTADAMTGAKEKYTAMGFTDYLAKPFTREAIAKKVTALLGNDNEEKAKENENKE